MTTNTTGTNELKEIEFLPMHTKDFTKVEVVYYLEEMIDMDLASEVEQDAYFSIKGKGFCPAKQLREIKNNMLEYYNSKF